MPNILAGKYILLKTIGEGSSCKVELALELSSNRLVAIKIMKSSPE